MTRALIFDLDDTLYLERRFALSGYAAVARTVEDEHGYSACAAFRLLRDEFLEGRRAQAFQRLARAVGLDSTHVDVFRDVYRRHEPRLRLPRVSRQVLIAARRSWRIGLLTNGAPAVQRNKVAALGLGAMVDQIIYAHEVGAGKPDPDVFLFACRALGVAADRAVMAGDDPWCDVDGARAAGLRSVRVLQGWQRDVEAGASGPADATVTTIAHVPEAAAALIHEGHDDAD